MRLFGRHCAACLRRPPCGLLLCRAICEERSLNSSTVLILAYHFYPSGEIGARRVTALARHLAARGLRVVVVSSFDGKPHEPGREILPGVVAISVLPPARAWLDALVWLKRRITRRSAAADTAANDPPPATARPRRWFGRLRELYFRLIYLGDGSKRWAWRAAAAAARAGRKYDARLIMASGPPHGALLAAAHAAGRLGIPLVADLRDPWSDSLAPSHRLELRLLRALEHWVVRRAAAITTTTDVVAALLGARYGTQGDRIQVVRNGYDTEVAVAPSATGGRLAILFAGELYVGRDPFAFLAALEWLLARPEVDGRRIAVTFMGKVQSYGGQLLEAWMRGKRCASVVRILPPQSEVAVAQAIASSTVVLNLAQQQPLAVPAKTYEHLASGREILLLCEHDCETARMVAGIRGVLQVDPADSGALSAALLDLYTRHVVGGSLTAPAAADVQRFSRSAANERFHTLFASLAPLQPAEVSGCSQAAAATAAYRAPRGLGHRT
jgi:glycosyltransferase involved in cell wall biosynthesis